jgi:hypothetical protein
MGTVTEFQFDKDKFKELVLYISERSEDDPWFGATKLNKILFYSDFLHYAYYGEPITGAEYQKLPQGPAPRKLLPVRDEMIKDHELAIRYERALKFTQKRPQALREADVSHFNGEELKLVDDIMRYLGDRTAGEVSELSHLEMCWQLAQDKETIPYEAIFLSSRKPSEAHFELALNPPLPAVI